MKDGTPYVPKATDFLPAGGGLEEQAHRQASFLTEAVVECMVRASELFEPEGPEPEPQPSYGWHRRPQPAPPPPSQRAIELRNAAHLGNATARLIAAVAKLRGEYRFTYTRIEKVEPGTGPMTVPPGIGDGEETTDQEAGGARLARRERRRRKARRA